MEDQWERAIADTGWELLYVTVPLVDGAIDLADLDRQIEDLSEWELVLIGHDPETTVTQLCFRRALPGREEHIRQIRLLQQHMQGRHN